MRRGLTNAITDALGLAMVGACSPAPPSLVVIGGGPAGLAAAVEAAGAGWEVSGACGVVTADRARGGVAGGDGA